MKTFVRFLLTVIIVIAILVGLLLLLSPSKVRVERSIVVDAPPGEVFAQVNDLQNWNAWSPWQAREPDMKVTYEGPAAGKGAIQKWESDTQGSGSQTITESTPPASIVTALDFGDMGTATSDWKFEAADSGTKVTWGMDSDLGNHPVRRIFGLFMDNLVGADYEAGLAKLKEVVEAK
jgi:hypothetical protein